MTNNFNNEIKVPVDKALNLLNDLIAIPEQRKNKNI